MDTVNVTDASDGQMELVLESDEEEASLLEEMEQQEAVPSADIGLECKRESVFDDTQQRENNKFPEVNDSLRTYLNKDTLGIHGNSQCRQSVQQSILPKFHSGKPVMEEVPDNEQEDQLEGAQILQLDISENDLIAAKSAVALQLQMETVDLPSTSFPPHFLSLDGVSGGLSLAGLGISHPDMGPSGADIKGKRKRIQKTSKLSDVKGGGCNHFKRPVGEHALSSGTQQKQEDKVPVGYIHQQEKNTKEDMNNGIVKNTKDFPRGIPTTESSEPPEVVFSCQFCNVKYPLEEENIPGIIKHLNPPQRYNHVFRMPEQLSCYKENIKLNVLIAKNKSKAQVQLYQHRRHHPIDG